MLVSRTSRTSVGAEGVGWVIISPDTHHNNHVWVRPFRQHLKSPGGLKFDPADERQPSAIRPRVTQTCDWTRKASLSLLPALLIQPLFGRCGADSSGFFVCSLTQGELSDEQTSLKKHKISRDISLNRCPVVTGGGGRHP